MLAQKPFFVRPTASLRRRTAKLTFRYEAEVFFEPPLFFHSVDFSIHQNRLSWSLVRTMLLFHCVDFSIHPNRLSRSLVRTILSTVWIFRSTQIAEVEGWFGPYFLFHRVDFSIHPNRLSRSLVRITLLFHRVDFSIHPNRLSWSLVRTILSFHGVDSSIH